MATPAPVASRAFRQLFSPEHLGSTLAVAGLVFALLSLMAAWFVLDYQTSNLSGPTYDYTLSQRVQHETNGQTTLVPYDIANCRCDRVEAVFTQAQLLIWSGALLAAAAYWGRSWGYLKYPQAKALTAIAGLLMLAAPVMLALNLPPAFLGDNRTFVGAQPAGRWGTGFLGTNLIDATHRVAWGPGLAWFFALVAAGLTLAAALQTRAKPAAATAVAPGWSSSTPVAAAPPAPQSNGGALPSAPAPPALSPGTAR